MTEQQNTSYPLYPQVKVKLIGEDGNAFAILGRVSREAKKHLDKQTVDKFIEEATSGDYDHLLETCLKYFTCE